MNRDLDRLQHMSDACELLLRVAQCEYDEYKTDRDKQAAVERYFEILGEAAKMISGEMQKRHPEIPWRIAGDTRNFIIHSYAKVSPLRLWESIRQDISPLFRQIRHLLGIYGDGWVPCTKQTNHPTDTENIVQITASIQTLKNSLQTCSTQEQNTETTWPSICHELSNASEAASLLTKDFRLAHPQIDWNTFISFSEQFCPEISKGITCENRQKLLDWLGVQEPLLISLMALLGQ